MRSRFFSFLVVSTLILGAVSTVAAASGSGREGPSANTPRNYGVTAPADYRGGGPGSGAGRAILPSFSVAARASEGEVAKQRATPLLMTERGLAAKARAEQGLNRSGKRSLQAPSTPPSLGPAGPASNFAGIGDTGFIPPDVEIAAGPHHVVEAVNGRITTFNKNGTQAETATSAEFYDALGTVADDFIFDPQVEYDEYVNRFVVVYTTRNDSAARSFLLIAVSVTDDPTEGWFLWSFDAGFDAGTNTNNWCDYPHLGYSVDSLIVTCNMFNHPPSGTPASFQYAKIRIFSTSQLSGGGGCCFWWDWIDFREGTGGTTRVFTVQPAAMHSAIVSDGAFLVAAEGGGGSGSNYHVYRIPTPAECCDGDAVGPGLDEAQRSVGSYDAPPDAEQPGSVQALDTGDARILYAVFHWPRLFVGQNLADGSDSTVSFTEFRIDSYPNNLTLDNDWIIGAGGMNRYYPGADSRPGSDKSQVYSFSNASTNAGSRWIEIPQAGTCTGCFNGEFLQHSGASTYLRLDNANPARNRWGDYLDASRDPNGIGIWVAGQYVASQDVWGTEFTITRQGIDTTAPTTTATVSPSPNGNGWNNTTANVLLNATDTGAAGVRRITFGATGANPIPTTTVEGSSATVGPITANGTTNVFYFATDNWGSVESTKFKTVRKDSVAPTITNAPHQSFQTNTGATNTTVPVRVQWLATDGTSGICSYGPLFRRDSPTGTFVAQPGLPSTSLGTTAFQQLAAGFHQYRIRSTDCAGNFSARTGRGSTLRILQEAAAAIAYSAGWTQVSDASAMGGNLRQTSQANRTATFSATGLRSVAWGARKDSGSGTATYKFDAQAPVNVNLQSATAQPRRVVAVTNTSAGSHTVVIRNLATAGHPKATLDFIAWLN